MKCLIDRVLGRQETAHPQPPRPSAISSEMTSGDIEDYYLRVISDSLKRLLVLPESVAVEVRRDGAGADGLSGFAGHVRILRWDPVVTPVLLQNMAVLDARIRKLAAASVLLQHTHFKGLWFQVTSGTPGAPAALVGLPAELVHQPVSGA